MEWVDGGKSESFKSRIKMSGQYWIELSRGVARTV